MLDAGPDRRGHQARFTADYTLTGVDLLLHRIGWSVQVPARPGRAGRSRAIAAWKEADWPVIKGRRRTWAPGSASKTSSAFFAGQHSTQASRIMSPLL